MIEHELQYAIELARAAGKVVLENYGKVERLTKTHVAAKEEAVTFDTRNPQGRNWVIDPIDGTNNFIAGLGAFAVCIGLLDEGYPILGVVYDVTRDLVYSAAKAHGAWLGTKQIHALQTPISEASMIMMTSNLLTNGRCPEWAYKWLAQTVMKARILGSAALEAVQVAAGIAHGAVTVNGKL